MALDFSRIVSLYLPECIRWQTSVTPSSFAQSILQGEMTVCDENDNESSIRHLYLSRYTVQYIRLVHTVNLYIVNSQLKFTYKAYS